MSEDINTPQNWDAASEGYAETVAPYLMDGFADDFIKLLDVNEDCEVLEVAAGSGALACPLAKKVKTLLATDFSPGMVDICNRRTKESGLINVTCKVMDGQSLELEDASFDRAVCMFGLMLFPDREKGFSELKRVLRAGGKALVTGWAGPDKFEAFGLFIETMGKAFPDMPKPDKPMPVFNLANLDNFKAEMELVGFKNVLVDYVSKKMDLDNFEELWGMLTVGAPPIREIFDKVGIDGQEHVKETLKGIIKERYGDGPIHLTNTATIGIGVV